MKNQLLFAALVLGISMGACAAVPVETMGGNTNCYRLFVLGVDIGESTFSASGFRVDAASGCPRIVSVKVVVFTDKNRNGIYDQGDVLHSSAYGVSDPPTSSMTTGSMAGGKSTDSGGTNWQATITSDTGGVTSQGGSF